MQVHVKAGGAIAEYVPGGSKTLDLADNASLKDALDVLGIGSDVPLMAIVNDDLVPAADYASTLLSNDSKLSLVQPIQAG